MPRLPDHNLQSHFRYPHPYIYPMPEAAVLQSGCNSPLTDSFSRHFPAPLLHIRPSRLPETWSQYRSSALLTAPSSQALWPDPSGPSAFLYT